MSEQPTPDEKRKKFRDVYRALKALEVKWQSRMNKSKKMQRGLAIDEIRDIRRLITKAYRSKQDV